MLKLYPCSKEEISQLNLQQLKAGEKRWLGRLLGSSIALLLKEMTEQSSQLYGCGGA